MAKDFMLRVRLTQQEHERYEQAAAQFEISVSRLVRESMEKVLSNLLAPADSVPEPVRVVEPQVQREPPPVNAVPELVGTSDLSFRQAVADYAKRSKVDYWKEPPSEQWEWEEAFEINVLKQGSRDPASKPKQRGLVW